MYIYSIMLHSSVLICTMNKSSASRLKENCPTPFYGVRSKNSTAAFSKDTSDPLRSPYEYIQYNAAF